MKRSLLLFSITIATLIPTVAQASAIKVCKVTGTIEEILKTGDQPEFTLKVVSSVFHQGHSAGEDCGHVGLFGATTVRLERPFATKTGARVVLYFTEVYNHDGNGRPLHHTYWSAEP